jgi:hypothetical protein
LLGCIPRGSDHGNRGDRTAPDRGRRSTRHGLLAVELSSLALGLRSRYLHTPTIIPAKKPLLDLYGDFVQPFLGTICPVHLIPNVCFQGLYAVFSCFELSRQLLSEIQTLVGSFSQPYWLRGEPSPGSSAPQPLADQLRFCSSRQREQQTSTRRGPDHSSHRNATHLLNGNWVFRHSI